MNFASVNKSPALVINAPEVFKDPDFVAWLNNGRPKFTWHKGGKPNDWSDIVVLVDPSLGGEGADSDMPELIWKLIVNECKKHFMAGQNNHIMVRLTNLEV